MSTIKFDSYYQSNSNTKEPIEWLVFWENVEGVRLISKYVLDCQPYNDSKDVIWENSTLHNWLNNEFYNEAFNVPWIVPNFIDNGGVNVNRLLIYKNNMKTLYFKC